MCFFPAFLEFFFSLIIRQGVRLNQVDVMEFRLKAECAIRSQIVLNQETRCQSLRPTQNLAPNLVTAVINFTRCIFYVVVSRPSHSRIAVRTALYFSVTSYNWIEVPLSYGRSRHSWSICVNRSLYSMRRDRNEWRGQ